MKLVHLAAICIVVLLVLVLSTTTVRANESDDRCWQISLSSGYNIAASESMRGSIADVLSDAGDDYIVSTYPFADPTLALPIELLFQLRVADRIHVHTALGSDFWNNAASTSFYDATAGLYRIGLELGASYRVLTLWNHFHADVRGGVQFNRYHGHIEVDYGFFGNYPTDVEPAFRIGAAGYLVLQYDLPDSPLSFGAVGGYSNGNLIGKSFTPPPGSPNDVVRTVELNDGANPDDPNDTGRVISLWTIRGSIGIRF